MYLYTPDEINRERAHHQAVIQGADDLQVKRIGNLGELAFKQFCREYLPVEIWEWENEKQSVDVTLKATPPTILRSLAILSTSRPPVMSLPSDQPYYRIRIPTTISS